MDSNGSSLQVSLLGGTGSCWRFSDQVHLCWQCLSSAVFSLPALCPFHSYIFLGHHAPYPFFLLFTSQPLHLP
ncbi:Uncharacterized protein HZ326_3408 [Fusarium oxysporum f. sp. albedinis]|nr:Uncharacterized protein HZ326_3408 [Fusarium oxysporum f. sp. albedinis]